MEPDQLTARIQFRTRRTVVGSGHSRLRRSGSDTRSAKARVDRSRPRSRAAWPRRDVARQPRMGDPAWSTSSRDQECASRPIIGSGTGELAHRRNSLASGPSSYTTGQRVVRGRGISTRRSGGVGHRAVDVTRRFTPRRQLRVTKQRCGVLSVRRINVA